MSHNVVNVLFLLVHAVFPVVRYAEIINIKLNWLSFSTIFSHSFVIIVIIIASIYLFIYLLMSLMLWNRLIAPYLCIMQSSI